MDQTSDEASIVIRDVPTNIGIVLLASTIEKAVGKCNVILSISRPKDCTTAEVKLKPAKCTLNIKFFLE